ncbi:alpha/beta hydrolase family protein [Streptoalloteichus hindustanus]|nr:lipase [Streptoalloteichus hindustanus]
MTALPAVVVTALVAPAGAAAAPAPSTPLTLTLPAPTGPHKVGRADLHLVDRSRPEPWVEGRPHRELMVSVWYPAHHTPYHPVATHMAPAAAADFAGDAARYFRVPAGSIDWAATKTHARVGAPVDRRGGPRPVVLFSSGLQSVRTLGSVLVEDLASRGYVVVTVDHTHEAPQVEFPGGRIERGRVSVEDRAQVEKAFQVRVADTRFVLDQITALNAGHNPDVDGARLPLGLRGALDLSRVAATGFSLGGAAAAQVTHDDPRIDVGVNLDGRFYGSVVGANLDRPFLLVANESHTHGTDPTWPAFRAAQRGWVRELSFAGAAHISFSDVQSLLPQFATRLNVPGDLVTALIGAIDPRRSLAAQRAYLAAFLDLHLRGRSTTLFDGPSPAHPDVRFVP